MTGHLRWTIIVQLRIVRDYALTTRYNSPALTFGSFTRMRTAVRTRTRPELLKYPLNAGILITGADDRIRTGDIWYHKPTL